MNVWTLQFLNSNHHASLDGMETFGACIYPYAKKNFHPQKKKYSGAQYDFNLTTPQTKKIIH